MAPPRTYRCEALTLKNTPLGESDLLVTLYTREHGKLRAVAKGARKSASKLVGHLEPLTVVRLSMAQGRSLDIVTQAQVLDSFPALKSNLTAITEGLYVAELTDGFGPEANANFELYQLAIDVLQVLASDKRSEMTLRYFGCCRSYTSVSSAGRSWSRTNTASAQIWAEYCVCSAVPPTATSDRSRCGHSRCCG